MKIKTCIVLLFINFCSSFGSTPVVDKAANSTECEGFIFMRESGETGVVKYDPKYQQLTFVRSTFVTIATDVSTVKRDMKSTTLAGKLDGSEAAAVIQNGRGDHDLVFQTIYSGEEEEIGPEGTKRHKLDPDIDMLSALANRYYGDTFEYSQSGDFFAFDYNGTTTVYDRRKGAESTDSVFRNYSPRSRFRTARKETPASRTQIARVEYGVASARLEIVDVVSNNIVESVDLGAGSLEYSELRDISFNENGTIALVTLFGESSANLQAVRLESSRDADSSGSSAGVVMWEDWFVLGSSIPPSVIVADEWVYYAHHFNIHKLNIASGNQEWRYLNNEDIFVDGTLKITKIDLLMNNSILFVSLQDTKYFALQTSNGKKITSYEPSNFPDLLDPPAVFTASYSGSYLYTRVKNEPKTIDWKANPFGSNLDESVNYYAAAAVYDSSKLDTFMSLDDAIDYMVIGRTVDTSRLVAAPRFVAITTCPPTVPQEITIGMLVGSAVFVGVLVFGVYLCYRVCCDSRKARKKDTPSTILVNNTSNFEEALPVATQVQVPATEQKVFQVQNPVRAVDDVIPVLEPEEDSKALY